MSQLEPFRVLLVDDEWLAESMAAVLAEQFTVRCGSVGPEALRARDLAPFHVVCADRQERSSATFKAVAWRDRK